MTIVLSGWGLVIFLSLIFDAIVLILVLALCAVAGRADRRLARGRSWRNFQEAHDWEPER